MKEILELKGLHRNVNRTEAGSESRLGTEIGSLRKFPAIGPLVKGQSS